MVSASACCLVLPLWVLMEEGGCDEMDNSLVFAGHDTRNKTAPIVAWGYNKNSSEAAQRGFV